MCIYTLPPPRDYTPRNGLAHKVHRLKRELQDLSVGTTKLEEASFVVTSASVPLRLKGAAVLPAAASGGGGVATITGSNVAVRGRWTKPAAAGVSAALGAGTGSLGSSAAVDRRNPRPSTLRGQSTPRPPAQSSPRGRSGQREGGGTPCGTEEEEACASTEPDKAMGRSSSKIEGGGAVNITIAALQVDTESTSGSDAGASFGGAGERTPRPEARAAQPRDIRFLANRENLLPCPLSGILDMSEPLRKQSSFCGDGSVRVASPPTNGGEAEGEEPQVGVEVLKCAVDSDGFVRHAESCVLRGVSPRRASTSGRFAFNGVLGENDSDDLGRIRVPVEDLPVRTCPSVEEPERDPVGMDGGTGAKSFFSRIQ